MHFPADSLEAASSGSFERQDGFTLLEVMIAVSILAITLVTLFGSQSKSLSLATEAKFNTVAPLLAMAKLAEIESGLTAMASDSGDFGEDFQGYVWEIEVSDENYDTPKAFTDLGDSLEKIELTVKWEETPFSYQLVYYGPREN